MQLPNVDRFTTLYFFYPLLKIFPLRNKLQIPILMYHSISEDKERGVHPYYKTNTAPAIFDTHMRFLSENNYAVVTLNEVLPLLRSLQTQYPQKKYVSITFDDGFKDFYTNAFPILQKYNFNATVFLPTGFINNNNGAEFKNKACMSWNEVRELYKKNITFGSHTVSHPQLRFLNKDRIEHEIKISKETIENKLGDPICSFSYPYSFPQEDKKFCTFLRVTLKKFGYKNGVSTKVGTTNYNDDIFFFNRIPVNSCDDISFFKAKLEGGYDWVRQVQHFFKILKNKKILNT